MTGSDTWQKAKLLLPIPLQDDLGKLSENEQEQIEEIRLRRGFPMEVTLPTGPKKVSERVVTEGHLLQVLDFATGYSLYTAQEQLRQGFFTAVGGIRLGVCGTVVHQQGKSEQVREISSIALRIPHSCLSIGRPLLGELFCGTVPQSTLIVAPPGGGKTTLLRDLVRLLSDGTAFYPPLRVSLVDERGEIAAMHNGVAQMDVGSHTDVINDCPKAIAIPMLLRSMNPQVLALDELALPEEVTAVQMAVGCGVALLATVHGDSVASLRRRAVFSELLDLFSRVICISGSGIDRRYELEQLS